VSVSAIVNYNVAIRKQMIFSALKDLKVFGSLHPLIKHVKASGPNRYIITERMSGWGKIMPPFKYTATVVEEKTGGITYDARPFIMKLIIHFTFEETGNITVVKEKVTIEGFKPFALILRKLVLKSHAKVFENLSRL
jgi:hypothetical protein